MGMILEFRVSDFPASLRFYTQLLGWQIADARAEEHFAMLTLGEAQLVINGQRHGRDFDAPLTPPAPPRSRRKLKHGRDIDAILTAQDQLFRRGFDLEITVPAIAPMLDSLSAAGHPLHLPPEEKWYPAGDTQIGQRQFIVADPDGYLLRFVEALGLRPAGGSDAL